MTRQQTPCQIFDISKSHICTRGNQRTIFFDIYIPAKRESLLNRLKIAFSSISAFYLKLKKSTQNGL